MYIHDVGTKTIPSNSLNHSSQIKVKLSKQLMCTQKQLKVDKQK